MGIDIIAWRPCPLQQELGPEEFLDKMNLGGIKAYVENTVDPDERDEIELAVERRGEEVEITYADLCDEVGDFLLGIPECTTTCLVSGRQPLGC